MESVVAACDEAIKSGVISKDVILNILLRKKDKSDDMEATPNIVYMKLKYTPTEDCGIYNQLLNVGA